VGLAGVRIELFENSLSRRDLIVDIAQQSGCSPNVSGQNMIYYAHCDDLFPGGRLSHKTDQSTVLEKGGKSRAWARQS
jgi:hypothetical protein